MLRLNGFIFRSEQNAKAYISLVHSNFDSFMLHVCTLRSYSQYREHFRSNEEPFTYEILHRVGA